MKAHAHRHGAGCGCGPAAATAPHALDRPAARAPTGDARASAAPYEIKPVDERARETRLRRLRELIEQRIVVLDGAMGTMIQRHRLDEAGYRGERFARYGRDIRGNNDVLILSRPEIVSGIHREYFEAGADIVETNTFNSNATSQADYGTEALVRELNLAAAQVARRAADDVATRTGRPRNITS
jgi:5-methyltetrahydrofolate--homocysteine methyltransferase